MSSSCSDQSFTNFKGGSKEFSKGYGGLGYNFNKFQCF